MEIKFVNLSYKEKNKYLLHKVNLKIKHNLITGIIGKNSYIIPKILTSVTDYQGEILYNRNILEYDLKKIAYIKRINNNTFLTKTVNDEFYLKRKDMKIQGFFRKFPYSR